MKLLFILFTLSLVSCSHFIRGKADSRISIVQGITTQKEIEFSVMTEKNENLRFELRNEDDEVHSPDTIKIHERDFSPYALYKILFTKEAGKEYNLIVYLGSKIIDQRLVGRGQTISTKLKLALISSIDDKAQEDDSKAWQAISKENPEYILFVGNTVQTEKIDTTTNTVTNPEILWNRNVDLRRKLPIFFQEKLIPIHAIWDDKDYGLYHGNTTYNYKEESQEIFRAFWAQELAEDSWSKGPGVSGVLNQGDFNLYFLDGRSFRSEDSDSSHLGELQSTWFYSKLKEEETPSLVIKGDPFFGTHRSFQSFERNHPKDFDQFVAELKKIPTPFVFISGDRHLSEIMQFPRSLFGKPSFELTAGPINGSIVSEEFNNPWRVIQNNQTTSFTLIENSAEENHWFIDIKNIGTDGKIYYRRDLAVFIKDLQNNLNEVRKRRYVKRRYQKAKPVRKTKRR